MLHIGQDIQQHELPFQVAESLSGNAPYLHVTGTGIEGLDRADQAAKILEISHDIGTVVLYGSEPASAFWRPERSPVPDRQLVRPHTDNPFAQTPNDIVAFWNVSRSGTASRHVVTPLAKILEVGEWSDRLAGELDQAQSTQYTFSDETESWTGPIIDTDNQTVRYDQNFLTAGDSGSHHLFAAAFVNGQTIDLAPGEVLFLNNTRAVHADYPYIDRDATTVQTGIRLNSRGS